MSIVASAEANITAYIKPVITFLLWDSVPIVLYPKFGASARFDIGSGSGCSNALAPHYQLYGELFAGAMIQPINLGITVPFINKPVGGLGRPHLPYGKEYTVFE